MRPNRFAVLAGALALAAVFAYTFRSAARAAPTQPIKAATWADVKPILAEHCVSCHTVGGVAPFPLTQVKAVFLDRSLLGHPIVWIGAGSTRHMAALAPTELMRLSRAEPMDAVETHT